MAVTANCDGTETWAAVVIGAFTPLFLVIGDWINDIFDVDDVIGAVPVHGACGVWGVIATGIFHVEHGVLYTGKWRFLGVQCIGLLATLVWSGALTFGWVWGLNRLRPIRIDAKLEESGADGYEHGIINAATVCTQFADKQMNSEIAVELRRMSLTASTRNRILSL